MIGISDDWTFNHKWDISAYVNKQNRLLETTTFLSEWENNFLPWSKWRKQQTREGPNLCLASVAELRYKENVNQKGNIELCKAISLEGHSLVNSGREIRGFCSLTSLSVPQRKECSCLVASCVTSNEKSLWRAIPTLDRGGQCGAAGWYTPRPF